VTAPPTVEQVVARLRAIGVDPDRAAAVAPELVRRLSYLADVDADLDDVAPAVTFSLVPGTVESEPER
jgi:hypothetical protein